MPSPNVMTAEQILEQEIARALADQTLNLSAPPGQVVDCDYAAVARSIIAAFRSRIEPEGPSTARGVALHGLRSVSLMSEADLMEKFGEDRLVAAWMMLTNIAPWNMTELQAQRIEELFGISFRPGGKQK